MLIACATFAAGGFTWLLLAVINKYGNYDGEE
jgi:hypothetical protein